MAYLDVPLLLTTVGILAVLGGISAFLMPQIAQADEEAQDKVGDLGGFLKSGFKALRTVKAFLAEEREITRAADQAEQAMVHQIRSVKIGAVVWSIVGAALLFALAGVQETRKDWLLEAQRQMHLAVSSCDSSKDPVGLCHGVAGLACGCYYIGMATQDSSLIGHYHRLCETLMLRYQSDVRFGYQTVVPLSSEPVDLPGVLNGTAGICMTLLLPWLIPRSAVIRSLTDGAPWAWW